MFWKEENDNNNNLNNSNKHVEVIISDISPEEWIEQTDNYMWLNQREIGRIKVYSEEIIKTENIKNLIGEIMLGDFFERKLYIKDSYIETTKNSKDLSICFGFNLDLELDRDRKCILNVKERNLLISQIIANILNNFDLYRLSINDREKELLDKFPEKIYNCLDKNYSITYNLHYYINENGANLIWKQLLKNNEDLEKKYPIYKINEVKDFIKEKKLSDDFYPFFQVSYQLFDVLENKENFITIKNKYENYLKNAPNSKIPIKYIKTLKEIQSIIIKLDKNFSETQIQFKQFLDNNKDIYYKDDKIFYFSNILLNEDINKKWKCFVLGNCLKMLDFPFPEIVSTFNIIN